MFSWEKEYFDKYHPIKTNCLKLFVTLIKFKLVKGRGNFHLHKAQSLIVAYYLGRPIIQIIKKERYEWRRLVSQLLKKTIVQK